MVLSRSEIIANRSQPAIAKPRTRIDIRFRNGSDRSQCANLPVIIRSARTPPLSRIDCMQ